MGLFVLMLLAAPLDVRVDGRPVAPDEVVALSSGAAVVRVDGIPLWLDGPGPWNLESVLDDGEVVAVRQQGQVLGVRVDTRGTGDAASVRNPLRGLSPAQLATLRGVAVEAWDPSVGQSLQKLGGPKRCLAVNEHHRSGQALAPLPNVGCLFVELTSSSPLTDLSALKGLTALRHLALGPFTPGLELDAKWLTANKGLESLALAGLPVRNPEALAALPALRRLELDDLGGPLALSGTFAALELLTARNCDLQLTALTAPGLRRLDLRRVPVESLPQMPVLQSLVALSTKLSTATLEAVRRRTPGAAVDATWASALHRSLRGATRVTVRTGGLCHREPEEEQVLLTLSTPKELTFLFTTFAVDEAKSQGVCMCCGGPTLTFWRDAEVLDEVSFQHGEALRWSGWPADATLADERLVHFLAEKGVTGPLEELEEEREHERATRAAFDRYQNLLPRPVFDLVRAGAKPEDAVAALTEGGLDAAKVVTVLKLYGASGGPMNLEFGLDAALGEKVVGKLSPAQLAATAGVKDDELKKGLARAVFRHRRADVLKSPAFASAVEPVAKVALSSPYRFDRVRALQLLGTVNTPATTGVLRAVLAGNLGGQKVAPPGMPAGGLVFEPTDGEYGEDVSEKALAALYLGQRKDAESMVKIRALAASAEGEEAKLLGKLGLKPSK